VSPWKPWYSGKTIYQLADMFLLLYWNKSHWIMIFCLSCRYQWAVVVLIRLLQTSVDALANTSDDSSFSDSSSVSRYRRHRTRNLRHRTHNRGQSTHNRVRHNLEEVETISEYTHWSNKTNANNCNQHRATYYCRLILLKDNIIGIEFTSMSKTDSQMSNSLTDTAIAQSYCCII
jgi:hypothetical protein